MSPFVGLQNVFFRTIITCIPLEPQFNADQSFIWNYRLKMYGLRDTGGQTPLSYLQFSLGFFYFRKYLSLYTAGTAI